MDLHGYAVQIGVDPVTVVWPPTRLVEDREEADLDSGVRSRVRGTPSLVVNGTRYRGPVTVTACSTCSTAEPVQDRTAAGRA